MPITLDETRRGRREVIVYVYNIGRTLHELSTSAFTPSGARRIYFSDSSSLSARAIAQYREIKLGQLSISWRAFFGRRGASERSINSRQASEATIAVRELHRRRSK